MIRTGIILLFLSTGTTHGQNGLPCDSIRHHFDSLSSTTIGLVQYDQGPALVGDYEQLHIASKEINAGSIFIWIVIDTQGKAQCVRVMRGDNKKLNDQAIKLVEGLNFTPAVQRGKAVISAMVLPVTIGEIKQDDKKAKNRK